MEGERTYPTSVGLTLEERRLVKEIGELENRTLHEQLKEFVNEGLDRRTRLMRIPRQLTPA
jgi:DNA-binding HxlR family transcriptional regulator